MMNWIQLKARSRTCLLWLVFIFLFGHQTQGQQNCYDIHESYSGILSLYDDPELGVSACALQDTIGSSDFKVLGLDLYPVLATVNPIEGYEHAIQEEYAFADSLYDGFILIIKKFNVDHQLYYDVRIKWGIFTVFDSLDVSERTIIEKELPRIGNTKYSDLNAILDLNEKVEAEILNRFMDFVINPFAHDLFEVLEFDEVDFWTSTIDVTASCLPSILNNVFDFAGLNDNVQGGLIADQARSSLSASGINMKMIYTSHSCSTIDLAISEFENEDVDFTFWLHFKSNSTAVYKVKANISETAAKDVIDALYAQVLNNLEVNANDPPAINGDSRSGREPDCAEKDCSPGLCIHQLKKWSAYCCLIDDIGPNNSEAYALGIGAGLLDGLAQTLIFLFQAGAGLKEAIKHTAFSPLWFVDLIQRSYEQGSFEKAFKQKMIADLQFWGKIRNTVNLFMSGILSNIWNIVRAVYRGFVDFLGDLNPFHSNLKLAGYSAGILVFEAVLTYITGGYSFVKKITKITDKGMKVLHSLKSIPDVKAQVKIALENTGCRSCVTVARIVGAGCFAENTSVLVANKKYSNPFQTTFGNSAKAMAVAASIPIVAVPIQDVQLFEYALVHKSVNQPDILLVSNNDDIYLGLIDESNSHLHANTHSSDPYTSEQQKQRDKYELNETDWYAVSFEQVFGGSKCQLALHQDWINKNDYSVDAEVQMNLPEQGINGPFRITSIKHILPQKIPDDSDPTDEYIWKPVTGLFTHVSDQVWELEFDNEQELGVTHNHPIYSVTRSDWVFAGLLDVGEEVLTYEGTAVATDKSKKQGSEAVYNLEVKDHHNFLVTESGVVVHNNYGIGQAIVNSIIAAIPAAFKKYGKCDEFGIALRNLLKTNGVEKPKAFVARLYKKNNPSQRANYDLWHNDQKIADNGRHVFTIVNDKVFDNMNPNGMPTAEFMDKFIDRIDATLDIKEIPFGKAIDSPEFF